MLFSWDEKKRQSNIKKHGIDFASAADIFSGPTFTWEDSRFDYGEQRWITMGLRPTGSGIGSPHRNRGGNPCHLNP
jgi:uncharacterized DUF497 family protein